MLSVKMWGALWGASVRRCRGLTSMVTALSREIDFEGAPFDFQQDTDPKTV